MIEANRALASGAELRGTVRLRAAEPCAADLSASVSHSPPAPLIHYALVKYLAQLPRESQRARESEREGERAYPRERERERERERASARERESLTQLPRTYLPRSTVQELNEYIDGASHLRASAVACARVCSVQCGMIGIIVVYIYLLYTSGSSIIDPHNNLTRYDTTVLRTVVEYLPRVWNTVIPTYSIDIIIRFGPPSCAALHALRKRRPMLPNVSLVCETTPLALRLSETVRLISHLDNIHVCTVNVPVPHEPSIASALACAFPRAGHLQSYTRVSFQASAQRLARMGQRAARDARDGRHRTLVHEALAWHGSNADVHSISLTAPTLRRAALVRPCDVLIAHMDGSSPNLRHSLRVDLPHMLAHVAHNGVVVAFAESPCAGTSVRPVERYAGPYGVFWEQCWVPGWEDLVGAGTITPLVPRRPNATCGGEAPWCAGRLVSTSLCRRQPPLLHNATRQKVVFTDPRTASLLRTALRYFTVLDVGRGVRDGSQGRSRKHGETTSPKQVVLMFKNEVQETWVGGIASVDGRRFEGAPRLVYPKHARRWPKNEQGVLTHNLAIARMADVGAAVDRRPADPPSRFVIIGGTQRNRALSGRPNQVWRQHA